MQISDSLLSMTPFVKQFREQLLADPDRPVYHFALPEALGQPGDPNGAFFANGRYHLMYLYRHEEKGFCWGHVSSIDLLHWRHHQDALVTGPYARGCFSGGAFVDQDGKAYITFWDYVAEGKDYGGIRIAVSSDPLYEQWDIQPEYIIRCNESMGIGSVISASGHKQMIAVADPSNIWQENGRYYLQTGNLCVLDQYGRGDQPPAEMTGDWTDLFASEDLVNWQYLHRFYQRRTDDTWTDQSEDDMCPSFLMLPADAPDGEASGLYLQLFISHNKGCQYYIGGYDTDKQIFLPEIHGRMSWADGAYFAPEALIDDQGRQIMWAWLKDDPENAAAKAWSGVYGFPRALWYNRHRHELNMAPVEELNQLRINPETTTLTLKDGHAEAIRVASGLSCELQLETTGQQAGKIGFYLRASQDRSEYTKVYYDFEHNELVLDSSKGAGSGQAVVERAPLVLDQNEKLHLQILIDHSVIEIYANCRQAVCRRVYPAPGSTGIFSFYEGRPLDVSVQSYEIAAANPF